MTRRIGRIMAALVIAGAAACTSPSARTTNHTNYMVEMRGMQYSPAEIMVAPGDTITWINRDIVPHTATSASTSASTSAAAGEGWDSGLIAADSSYLLVVGEGDFGEYKCMFHPAMTGRITRR